MAGPPVSGSAEPCKRAVSPSVRACVTSTVTGAKSHPSRDTCFFFSHFSASEFRRAFCSAVRRAAWLAETRLSKYGARRTTEILDGGWPLTSETHPEGDSSDLESRLRSAASREDCGVGPCTLAAPAAPCGVGEGMAGAASRTWLPSYTPPVFPGIPRPPPLPHRCPLQAPNVTPSAKPSLTPQSLRNSHDTPHSTRGLHWPVTQQAVGTGVFSSCPRASFAPGTRGSAWPLFIERMNNLISPRPLRCCVTFLNAVR